MVDAQVKKFLDTGQRVASGTTQVGIGVRQQMSAVAAAPGQVEQALNQALGQTFGDALQSPVPPRASKIDEALRQTKPGQPSLSAEDQRDEAANVATNQSQPSNSAQPGQQVFRPDVNAGLITGNPLSQYVDVQYHAVLSIMPEASLSSVQPDIISQGASGRRFLDEMSQSMRPDGSVTLASTGEVFRNEATEVFYDAFEAIPVGAQMIDQTERGLNDLRKQLKEAEASGNEQNVSLISASILNQERILTQMRSSRQEEILANTRREQVNFSDRSYYNIKSLSFNNIMGATKENPMISNLIALKMVLVEPHGFQLHDDIRRLGKELGYEGVHYHRMIYRLDIFFSGWNQDTGEYVPLIPITIKASEQTGGKSGIISYYLVITKMNGKVAPTGTEYTIDLAPAGALALRPEEAVIEATNVEVGKDPTFGDFLGSFSTELAKAKVSQSKGEDAIGGTSIERIYEFIAPKDLLQARFNERKLQAISSERGATPNPDDGFKLQFRQGMTVMGCLEKALHDLPAAQERFLVDGEDNADFSRPRIRYTVRLNTIYEQKNVQINDYGKIRFQYIIEPHYTYKDFEVKSYEQSLVALSFQARLRRLREMISLGMVQRKYSYLFTSENTEVIDLDLDFSMFYYSMLSQDDSNTQAYAATAASLQSQTDANKQDATIQGKPSDQTDKNNSVAESIQEAELRRRLESNVEQSLKRLFGVVPSLNIRENAAGLELTNQAIITAPKAIRSEGSNRSDSADPRKNLFLRSMRNNLENDLIQIELKVRGDPIYLFSPYATESLNVLDPLDAIRYNNTNSEGNPDVDKFAVQPSTDKVIFLAMHAPEQTDYMNPERKEAASSRNSIIGGFYQVIEVENSFTGGQFTQTLKAVKMANLNYLAENIDLFEPTPGTGNTEVAQGGATPNEAVGDRVESENG